MRARLQKRARAPQHPFEELLLYDAIARLHYRLSKALHRTE